MRVAKRVSKRATLAASVGRRSFYSASSSDNVPNHVLQAAAASVPIDRMSSWALARAVLRSCHANTQTVPLWKAYARRATDLADTLQAADISMIAFSFARMKLRDRTMLDRFAEVAPSSLSLFRPVDIAYYLNAHARLDVRNDMLFNVFAREVARKAHNFTPRQLAEVIFSYAALGYRHAALFDVLRKQVALKCNEMEPWHMALVANGFARLQLTDLRLFALLATEICRKIMDFPAKPLALVANSYARLGVQNRFLLEVLGDEVFRKRAEFSNPQSMALILNAYARLGVPGPVLFDYFAQEATRKIRQFDLQSICVLVSAYSRTNSPSGKLFEVAGERVGFLADQLYPRAIAMLVHAFAQKGERHGLLLYHVPELVQRHADKYTIDELGMLCHAYGSLQLANTILFDAVLEQLPAKEELLRLPHVQETKEIGDSKFSRWEFDEEIEETESGPRLSSVVWILDAMARVLINHEPAVMLLTDVITERRAELDSELLVMTTVALSELGASVSDDHMHLLLETVQREDISETLTSTDSESLQRSFKRIAQPEFTAKPLPQLPLGEGTPGQYDF